LDGFRGSTREDIELQEATKLAVSLSLDAPVREALKLMRKNNVPGVPVVGEDGALEGFVTDGYLIASALPRYMRLMDNLSHVDRRFCRCEYDAAKTLEAISAKLPDGARTLAPADAARCPQAPLQLQRCGEPEVVLGSVP
jgi:hypothetical protein